MTKKHSTKRALIASVLVLCLCLTSFIGTTFAWFTDSVTSANNIIKSGSLDVVLEYKTDYADDWQIVDENTKIFNKDALYEPGYTEVVYLRVSNAGTLALKYNLKANIASEKSSTNVNGDEFKLSDYLQIGSYVQDEYNYGFNYADILMPVMFGTREAALSNVRSLETLSKANTVFTSDAPILVGDKTAQVLAIVLTMPEDVGNEANAKSGFAAPEINLGITLTATQMTAEQDSFGADYDEGALYLANASESVKVKANASAALTVAKSAVSANVPAKIIEALPAGITEISLGHSDPVVDNTKGTVSFDSIEIFDQNGKAIDLSALDTDAKITVTLPVDLADGTDVVIYHDGEQIATATVASGFVTYEAAHFCEVVVTDAENVYDYVVCDLEGLTTAFAKGGSVLLTDDVKLEKLVSVMPGADVKLDMNGKKITVNQNTASNTLIYVKDGASLVIYGNGTIDLEAVSTMAIFAPYGSLTIENGTFIRDEVKTVTNKTTGLFMGAKSTNSNVVINGGYFDAGYYDKNAANIEAILAGEAKLEETADDIAKRNNSKDANLVRTALKDNVSVLLNHSGYGSVKIYGGTFVGANPAWGDEGCMLPTTPEYLRPWSYYQGALLDGQEYNAEEIVLPDGYSISMVVTEAGVPVYTVSYSK